ncbi:unnamed protein product [Linum tenue]|uniref:Uncharacterized protein n=1 Tax=Linum tenue TaxID=586396 RepID=A0AAV0RDE9_9ROSI|nr:unnamed protein product [Linum tenue]
MQTTNTAVSWTQDLCYSTCSLLLNHGNLLQLQVIVNGF